MTETAGVCQKCVRLKNIIRRKEDHETGQKYHHVTSHISILGLENLCSHGAYIIYYRYIINMQGFRFRTFQDKLKLVGIPAITRTDGNYQLKSRACHLVNMSVLSVPMFDPGEVWQLSVCLTEVMQQVGEVRGLRPFSAVRAVAPQFPSSPHIIALSTTNRLTNTLALLLVTALMFCLNSVRLHVFSSLKY